MNQALTFTVVRPDSTPLPFGYYICQRCGIERRNQQALTAYCSDCKRFAKADGWIETEVAA